MAMEGTRSKKLEKICRKLVKKYRGRTLEQSIEPERVVCLKVYGAIKAKWIGRIHRVAFPYNSFIDYDYIIQFNWDMIIDRVKNKKQLNNLVIGVAYHELRHIAPEGKLKRHDVEDFADLIRIRKLKGYEKIPNLLKISRDEFIKLLGEE